MKQWLLTIHLHVTRLLKPATRKCYKKESDKCHNTHINKYMQTMLRYIKKQKQTHTKQNTKTNKAKTKYCSPNKSKQKQNRKVIKEKKKWNGNIYQWCNEKFFILAKRLIMRRVPESVSGQSVRETVRSLQRNEYDCKWCERMRMARISNGREQLLTIGYLSEEVWWYHFRESVNNFIQTPI